MVRVLVFLVGICALGCKGDSKTKPVAAGSATGAGSGAAIRAEPSATGVVRVGTTATVPPEQRPPDPPTLAIDSAFEAEEVNRAWADATERAIEAVAPELSDVSCRARQCRGTLAAATEQELVAKTERIQRETSLRGLEEATGVVLTAPETVGDKLTMKIYVRFD